MKYVVMVNNEVVHEYIGFNGFKAGKRMSFRNRLILVQYDGESDLWVTDGTEAALTELARYYKDVGVKQTLVYQVFQPETVLKQL